MLPIGSASLGQLVIDLLPYPFYLVPHLGLLVLYLISCHLSILDSILHQIHLRLKLSRHVTLQFIDLISHSIGHRTDSLSQHGTLAFYAIYLLRQNV